MTDWKIICYLVDICVMVTTIMKDIQTNGVLLGGRQLKRVENVKYLGSVLKENGRNDK